MGKEEIGVHTLDLVSGSLSDPLRTSFLLFLFLGLVSSDDPFFLRLRDGGTSYTDDISDSDATT